MPSATLPDADLATTATATATATDPGTHSRTPARTHITLFLHSYVDTAHRSALHVEPSAPIIGWSDRRRELRHYWTFKGTANDVSTRDRAQAFLDKVHTYNGDWRDMYAFTVVVSYGPPPGVGGMSWDELGESLVEGQ